MTDNRNRCYQLNIDIQNERLRLNTVSAGIGNNPVSGFAKAGATAWSKQAGVNRAREEYNSLRTEYDSLLSNQKEYEREIDDCYNKIKSLENHYRETRC